MTFDSTSMEWLVVTGQPRAMFKGDGELKDGTVCKFQVDAWDGSFPGSGADAFGITIFACGPGGAINRYALDAVAIDGGNIKIHQT